MFPQLMTEPPSITREVNVPAGAYGGMRSQSTETAGPPTVKSLTIGRIDAAIAIVCDATCVPSMK